MNSNIAKGLLDLANGLLGLKSTFEEEARDKKTHTAVIWKK